MPWQIAIAISILAITATSLVKRHHSQKSLLPSTLPPAISFLFGVAPLGIIAGLFLPHKTYWSLDLLLILVLIAISAALCNWLAFTALKRIPITRYQLISLSESVMIVSFGWIILGEKLSLNQLIGASFLLTSAILAVSSPLQIKKEIKPGKFYLNAVIFALLSCFFGAVSLLGEKIALGKMEIGAYLIYGYSAQTIGLLLLALKDFTKVVKPKLTRSEISWAALMGLANGFGGIFYVIALVGSNNISLITAIAAIGLPLLALGAFVFLKERENQKLLWASLLIGFFGLLIGSI